MANICPFTLILTQEGLYGFNAKAYLYLNKEWSGTYHFIYLRVKMIAHLPMEQITIIWKESVELGKKQTQTSWFILYNTWKKVTIRFKW